jgi:hypothetical protein
MLPEFLDMVEKEMVGYTNGCHFCINTLRDWVKNSWMGLLNSFPLVNLLTKGWFMLRFYSFADVAKVLKDLWCIELSSFLLKRWTSFFYAILERIDDFDRGSFFGTTT